MEVMVLRIDVFSHFSTMAFREAYFSLSLGGKGRRSDPLSVRSYLAGQSSTNIDVLWDIDQRVRVLDRHGIDLQVLTLSYPMLSGLEPEEEVRLARVANDSLAEIIRKYPGRFVGVATLPFSSQEDAVRELDRCVTDLGFKGFQISSNVNGLPVDTPDFFPLFQRAAELDVAVWLHPTTPVTLDILGSKGNVDILFGWPMDTSIALLKLVISGVLEKLPTLKVIVHHLGAGLIPYFIGRLDTLYSQHGELNLVRPPSYYWKKMYHDTAAIDASSFECGFSVFGEDHVVFGVDYPFGHEKGEQFLRTRREIVDGAKISETERRKIYEDNARKLLKL